MHTPSFTQCSGLDVQGLSPDSLCCGDPCSACLTGLFGGDLCDVTGVWVGTFCCNQAQITSPGYPHARADSEFFFRFLPFYCPSHIQHLCRLSLFCIPGLSPHGDLPHMTLVSKSLRTASLHSIMIMFCGCYHWRSACSGLPPAFTHLLSD